MNCIAAAMALLGAGWRVAVEALGFTPQRPFARMYRGAWRPAGDASLLFGSIGAEFG